MSLAHRILAPLLIIGLLFGGLLGSGVLSAWQAQGAAEKGEVLSRQTGALTVAGGGLALERGQTNGLLSVANAPAEDWARARIRRAEAEALVASARPDIDRLALTDPSVAAARTAHDAAAAAVAALRTRVDGPAEARPAAPAWFAAASARIDALTALRRAMENAGAGANRVDALYAARDALSEIAEYRGRERGLLNGIIAANRRLAPAEIGALGAMRGRQEGAEARLSARLANLPASVAAAVMAAESQIARDFAPLRTRVLAAGVAGEAYPVAAGAWFTTATAAIAALQQAEGLTTEALAAAQGAARSAAAGQLAINIGMLVAGLLTGLAAAWYVWHRVTRPLRGVVTALSGLAAGRLDTPIPPVRGQDEIAQLAAATTRFRDLLSQNAQMQAEAAESARALDRARSAALEDVASLIERETTIAMEGVRQRTDALDSMAAEMTGSAARAAQSAASAAALAGQSRGDSETAAGATGELAGAVAEVSSQMALAGAATRQAVERTGRARQVFDELATSMAQIGGVSRLIADIAARTNLLALNATIEAARAGEAGKGFAVVATEVKNLAGQTARSTEEIGQRIAAIEATSREAMAAMEGITQAVGQIDHVATAIAAAVEEQSATAREIARSVGNAAEGAGAVATQIGSLADDAAQAGTRAGQVQQSAAEVAAAMGALRGQLVGVMRIRMSELNRRVEERHALPGGGRPAHLAWTGGEAVGQVRDLSLSGAGFRGVVPAGLRQASLRIEGLPGLPVTVVRHGGEVVGLAFAGLDPAQTAALARLLPGRAQAA